ncbi:hypothetical protein [Nakamurella lactea]|uniref:hypothetical protein n=1 Tax=Nakamurella lactea TaxID=459515 RepID=UPI0003F5FC22|nr:hypothetical protein [Nakamurella lactea]
MTNTENRREIRRADDDELLGFVAAAEDAGGYRSLTVFGGLLGIHDDGEAAEQQVRSIGLQSLAERWWIHSDGRWERCHLIEASPDRLLVMIATYAFEARPQVVPPGTPLQLAEPADLG